MSNANAAPTVERIHADRLPRLPLKGSIDLTYRCNNSCRHCWLQLPAHAPEQKRELTPGEIRRIADDARSMGCREWAISGGEPMLRPDFTEIFDYLTRRAKHYTLNTNGTLITPEIARLMTRRGTKLVALYGATADVHDHITRNPGSFEALMRGFRYLKEAGAGFTVQIIPLRDSYHQYQDMVKLAQSLSPHHRVGAAWLYLSACASPSRNAEIARQRLDPKDVIRLDEPDASEEDSHSQSPGADDDRLYANCIAGRRSFHVDPYGAMTFCSFIKDPALRYDLRRGTFREAWEEFILGLADKVRGNDEYRETCGSCSFRKDCRWCSVYGYLEHGRHGAKVEYLCDVARANREFKEEWMQTHRRYFQIAGITIQVESDLPITDGTFDPKFRSFETTGPGPDTISIRHHFQIPDLKGKDLGREVYRKTPWAIYRKDKSWTYLGISPSPDDPRLHRVVMFNNDYTKGEFYADGDSGFTAGGLHSLTLFPTDQILLAPLLADRQACFLHSAGVVINGQGLLFVGHSSAGKSTTVKMIKDRAEILCDARNIVRRAAEGFRVYGTWSHGEVPLVSSSSAPLRAILFIEQAQENSLTRIADRSEAVSRLLACIIRSFETADWWTKSLAVIEMLARETPCYIMKFDLSGKIADQIVELTAEKVRSANDK